MTRVKLKGRELTVADDRVAEYLERGYSVIDSKGNTVAFGNAPSYDAIVEENRRLKDENLRLRKSNETLCRQKEDISKQLEEALAKLKKIEPKATKSNK